jgi:NADPH:quinone reductase-like Zn-dependent oxidoreductase
MRAVQLTRFGGPEVLDVVDLPDPIPAAGEQLFEVSRCGVNVADTHHSLCGEVRQRRWTTSGGYYRVDVGVVPGAQNA